MNSYWKRNKRKIKDHPHHNYDIIIVAADEQIYKKTKKYLSGKAKRH